ncbi:Ppx/GppA phosphatase family protein [Paenibacillus sp. GP183]|uniref:Ppx/GppA phosphatase family protein n=1 Tax=Paenibacillus sp. GP183 TaxID=1882751 RepID=UPI00089CA8CA|nr:Ppx/GppA phosphatase family protein [Paenibacillus sp. GP183]SEB88965.1 exopolyphosphatase / guanosine-5'-triphosphate,3'-diphosphate pyrophosphatase [Paenibacillus sp. GP183]
MSTSTRIGIMDIGSNSIRLVIYELGANGGYRVVSEYKESARLSERIGDDGILHLEDILSIVPILTHFSLLCTNHEVTTIRSAATAAIRNAVNSREIVDILRRETGLPIEVLSGAEEARYGFLGVINTIDIRDGLIVDIGGGSTEVTLFRNRKMLHSISFPFGSVNTTSQFSKDGFVGEDRLPDIRRMVLAALSEHPWIQSSPGLALIGLGGTIRNLGKMNQKRQKYSLPIAHNYMMQGDEVEFFLKLLSGLPLDKRRRIDGMSKERADIIVPGLTILDTIYKAAGASACLISGSGLRDGLFYEAIRPEQPMVDDVLEASIQNLLRLHPNAAGRHVQQVNKLAMKLFDDIADSEQLYIQAENKPLLHAASLLYRVGVSVHYYQFSRHTQYVISQARIDGFTHREMLLCSLIAAYKTKSRNHQMVLMHKDILKESDELLIMKLAALLQLSIAMDRSEIQAITHATARIKGNELQLKLTCNHDPFLELKEIADLDKEFQKMWKLKLIPE